MHPLPSLQLYRGRVQKLSPVTENHLLPDILRHLNDGQQQLGSLVLELGTVLRPSGHTGQLPFRILPTQMD